MADADISSSGPSGGAAAIHASTHATAGSDPVSPSSIGAPSLVATPTTNAIAKLTSGGNLANSGVTIDSSNNIALPALSTVDGRDLSVDGAKLDLMPTSVIGTVGVDGSTQTAQGRINLISGTGVTVTGANNAGTSSTDVTLSLPGLIHGNLMAATVVTTDANSTSIGPAISIPSGQIATISFQIHGRLTANDGSVAVYRREYTYTNTAGTVSNLINQTPVVDFESATPTNMAGCSLPAPTTSNGSPGTVQIKIVGLAAASVTWSLMGRYMII